MKDAEAAIKKQVDKIQKAALDFGVEVEVIWKCDENKVAKVEIYHYGMIVFEWIFLGSESSRKCIVEMLEDYTSEKNFPRNLASLKDEADSLYSEIEPGQYEVSTHLMDMLREGSKDPVKSLRVLLKIRQARFPKHQMERMLGVEMTRPIRMMDLEKIEGKWRFACTISIDETVIMKHGFLVLRRMNLPEAINHKIKTGGYQHIHEIIDHPRIRNYKIDRIEIDEYKLAGNAERHQNLIIHLDPEECFETVDIV